jgi:hypothetical protein
MGSSYTNVTLRGPSQARVAERLRAAGAAAYVSPARGGVTVVYDCRSEEADGALRALTLWLSRELRCAALGAQVYDSDVFAYWLARDGEMRDEYDSFPGYRSMLSRAPRGGDAAVLCREIALGPCDAAAVERILRDPDHATTYLFEEARHGDLLRALGHPDLAFDQAYHYIAQGDPLPEGVTPGSLLHLDGNCGRPYPGEAGSAAAGPDADGGRSGGIHGLRDWLLWLVVLFAAAAAFFRLGRGRGDVTRRDFVRGAAALLLGSAAGAPSVPRRGRPHRGP